MTADDRFHTLRAAGVATYQDLGAWTYDSYAEINHRYFDNAVSLNAIQWGITPYGRLLGFYHPLFDTITLHQSLLEPSGYGSGNPWGMGGLLGKALAYDVLLHEMVHQLLHQQKRYAENDDAHNCQAWCAELNRIGRLLELPYYYTPHYKTTKRILIPHDVIVGKYCDLETRRVRHPPKKAASVWLPCDKGARETAESLGLQLANPQQLLRFPYNSKSHDYYSQGEQNLLQQQFGQFFRGVAA